MPIMKKSVRDNFTVVHNTFINDHDVDWDGKGMLLYMMSKPDKWKFSIKCLASQAKSGEHKVSSILKNLKEAGYLKMKRERSENGNFTEVVYYCSDEPIFKATEEDKGEGNSVDAQSEPHYENRNMVEDKAEKEPQNDDQPQCGFPAVDNPDLGNPDVSYPDVNNRKHNKYCNNQIPNNQILNNQSFNQSNTRPSKNDRTMDGNTIPTTYDVKVSDHMTLTCESYEEQLRSYKEVIKEKIEYDDLIRDKQFLKEYRRDLLDEIVDIMLECVTSTSDTIRVSKEDMPTEVVRNRMLKLTREHIENVLKSIAAHAKSITNIKTYIITALYNASFTLNIGVYAETSYDMRNYFSER